MITEFARLTQGQQPDLRMPVYPITFAIVSEVKDGERLKWLNEDKRIAFKFTPAELGNFENILIFILGHYLTRFFTADQRLRNIAEDPNVGVVIGNDSFADEPGFEQLL